MLETDFFCDIAIGLEFCDHLLLEKKGIQKVGRWGSWGKNGLPSFDTYY
jgi:hypothetical protein